MIMIIIERLLLFKQNGYEGDYMKELKVIFMGTPIFSVPILEALIENCNVIGVVTQPDNVIKGKVVYSPIKELAIKHNIKVLQPEKVKTDFYEMINLKPEIIITCAYGQIIPGELIEYPTYGCINVHASLLPKLRGGAPIHWAIINGYSETGITIMYMNEKMDDGDIISQSKIEITAQDNVETLHNKLSIMGKDLLIETLPNIISGNITRTKQNRDEATFAWNLKREDEKIDFDKSKREIYNKIRGLSPWPVAYAIFEGKVTKIWNSRIGEAYYSNGINGEIMTVYKDGIGVKVNNGEIIITEIQLEGKKRMDVKTFLNGVREKEKLIGKIFE